MYVLKYKNSDEYYNEISKLEEDELLEEYTIQNYKSSYIAKSKFIFVNKSIFFLIINITLPIFFLKLRSLINFSI